MGNNETFTLCDIVRNGEDYDLFVKDVDNLQETDIVTYNKMMGVQLYVKIIIENIQMIGDNESTHQLYCTAIGDYVMPDIPIGTVFYRLSRNTPIGEYSSTK